MKYLNLILLFFSCLLSSIIFAQTPQQIEHDLLKSFKKIGYWDERLRDTTINASDSLDKANNVFGEKLQCYTEKYPSTLVYPFVLLKKEFLNVSSSTDGLFRIYSWDTGGGGTMREFQNVIQYKVGQKTCSVLVRDTATGRQDKYVPYYTNLYTFQVRNKTYYLGIYEGVYCSACRGQGLQVFSIENGKLNDDVKIIKTGTGLHSQLYYEYNLFSVLHQKPEPSLHFNAVKKIIFVPVILEHEQATNRYIQYKFTGQYFERVKN